MDWSRAKVILILAFSLLNIFLGVLTYSNNQRYYERWAVPTAAEVRNLENQLKALGVTMAGTWPLRAAPLPFLLVKASPVPADEVARKVFGLNVPGIKQPNGEKIYSDGQQTLLVTEAGIIRYHREGPAKPAGGKAPEKGQVKTEAEALLQRRGLLPGARLDYIHQDEERGRTTARYSQVYEGLEIFSSEAWFEFSANGLEEYRERWLVPLGFTGEKRLLVSPVVALARLLQRPDVFPGDDKVIESITVGYYSAIYDARQWEATPVWRVRFKSGKSLYLNAYTGEPEKETP